MKKLGLYVLLAFSFTAQIAEAQQRLKVQVMAPLRDVSDWTAFEKQLQTLKKAGTTGITTDIWWGKFEASGDNQFDWSYYKKYAQLLRKVGLKWVPILAFHRCGDNVGDDCDVPLPNWVWSLGPASEMKFKGENGYISSEYVSFWFEDIYQQYDEALKSFGEHFLGYDDIIDKVYLSLGPAGELRYPSYYGPAGWYYPNRGFLQSYSASAQRSFREYVRNRYSSLESVNSSWGTRLKSFNEIQSPTDGDRFFESGYKSAYGKDFLEWYQETLLNHLRQMMSLASANLPASWSRGIKMAGIHWLHKSPRMPRAAEKAAGYVDYAPFLNTIAEVDADFTFTCLEMDDWDANTDPYFSSPKLLVENVSREAQARNLRISGENALSMGYNPGKYWNIRSIVDRFNYDSFTLLRMNNLVTPEGFETDEMQLFKQIIVQRKSFKEWVKSIE